MICANPACGHIEDLHRPDGCIAIDRVHRPQVGLRPLLCPCNAFSRPDGAREPLLAQLDAVIRTRTQLP